MAWLWVFCAFVLDLHLFDVPAYGAVSSLPFAVYAYTSASVHVLVYKFSCDHVSGELVSPAYTHRTVNKLSNIVIPSTPDYLSRYSVECRQGEERRTIWPGRLKSSRGADLARERTLAGRAIPVRAYLRRNDTGNGERQDQSGGTCERSIKKKRDVWS